MYNEGTLYTVTLTRHYRTVCPCWMAKPFTPSLLCKTEVHYANAAFVQPSFRTLDNWLFTFAHVHAHLRAKWTVWPTNAKYSHADLSEQRLPWGENERELTRVQMKRGISAPVIDSDQCMLPSCAVREACCGQICSWTFAQCSASYANGTKHWHCLDFSKRRLLIRDKSACSPGNGDAQTEKPPSRVRTHSALTNCPELKPLATYNMHEPARPIPTHPRIVHR